MRVGVRVDAGPLMGGGHAMRCLTLADILAERGSEVTFVTWSMPDVLENRIRAAGHQIAIIPPSPEMDRTGQDWHEPPFSDQAQREDAASTRSALSAVDWLIVDHYLLDARWHSEARSFARKLIVIDDLANRPYDCDLLVDQTLRRSPADYEALVPKGATVLAGSTFALLRPEFLREREASLRRRREARPVKRMLISIGTIDPEAVTARIVRAVVEVAPECALDVVLSPEAPSLGEVQKLARDKRDVRVHAATDKMAELMREADLAIGAGGTTSWERCCLAVPSIVLVLADNQAETAQRLKGCGAALVATDVGQVGGELAKLLRDPRARQAMTAAAAAIVDGRGAERVAHHIEGVSALRPSDLRLRTAKAKDEETLWLWRNDPLTRAMAKRPDPIPWSDHRRWFAALEQNEAIALFIADLAGEPVAMVRFDRSDGQALVSINVAPALRGVGLGSVALETACNAYQASHGNGSLVAEIRHSNAASRSAFRAAGFVQAGSDKAGMATFVRHGSPVSTGAAL